MAPMRLLFWAFVVSASGAFSGARVFSGWRSKVNAMGVPPMSSALCTTCRKMFWWPRCTPSKLPSASTGFG